MEFHGNINYNFELDSVEVNRTLPVVFKLKVFEVQGVVFRKNVKKGLWIYETREITLKPNDTIYFWILAFVTDEIKVHKIYSEFTVKRCSNGTLNFIQNNTRLYT